MNALAQLPSVREQSKLAHISLSDGVTVYDTHGQQGPWVILVHGVFTPMATWDRLVPRLVRGGTRVLRYDAFGVGLSDRPKRDLTSDLYVRQLAELLDALRIDRCALIGWSLGAVTVARYAAQHPGVATGLGLIAPALLTPRPTGLRGASTKIPGLGAMLSPFLGAITEAVVRGQIVRPDLHRDYAARLREQLRFPGLGRALASVLANFPWDVGQDLPQHVRDLPALLVLGKQDPTVPYARAREVGDLFADPDWCVLEQGRHAPHYDYADSVSASMLSWLAATEQLPSGESSRVAQQCAAIDSRME